MIEKGYKRTPYGVLTIHEYRRRLSKLLGVPYDIAKEITDAMSEVHNDAINHNEGIVIPYIGAVTVDKFNYIPGGYGTLKMRAKVKLRKSNELKRNLRGESDKVQKD